MATAYTRNSRSGTAPRPPTTTTPWLRRSSSRALLTGLLIHTAGFDEDAGVFRIFDVWESRERGSAVHLEQRPVNSTD